MLVVADASPLIALVNVGHVAVLPKLFASVTIPPTVARELSFPNRPPAVREFAAAPPPWLLTRAPSTVEPIPLLHDGERAAISLAAELRADLLLIDEAQGRRAAVERHIPITGTIGILELAADRHLLDLAEAFDRLKRTDFWISHGLLDQRLKLRRRS
jgi:predicted nucleic acid-binding protein